MSVLAEPRTAALTPTLIGRQREEERLEAALAAVEHGHGAVVSVDGPAGLGKSSLLRWLHATLAEHDVRVLATQGRAADAEIGFASLLSLLHPVEAELDQLADGHATAIRSALALDPRRTNATAVHLALYRVIVGLAGRGTVALLIDDAHLLDRASADALAFAVSRLGMAPVLVVFTTEPGAPTTLDRTATDSVHLAPLESAAVRAIVSAASPVAGDALDRCVALAQGNPLAALELVAAVDRTGSAPPDLLPDLPKPVGILGRALADRIGAEDATVDQALAVVAADDSGERAVVEAALAELGEHTDGLDAAEVAGLVTLTPRTVAFTHPLLRPVAYHGVAPTSRRAAHRALASALDQPHQGASRAWQLAAATDGTDETAAAALELVALDARRRGGAASAGRTAESAAFLSPDPEQRRDRLELAARCWLDAGDAEAAERVVELLDPLPPSSGAAEVVALVQASESSTLDGLTPAEQRVATAVAEGRTNKEVAADLYLSVKTVDFHLQHIYRKLAIRSRTELAVRVAGGLR